MELAVLDSQFRRKTLVENWNSLIWSERYSESGDFELTSNDIAGTLEKLPLPAEGQPPLVVAIRDSTVPMIVETHKIETDSAGAPQIVTSGRSFETCLDRRITIQSHSTTGARAPWVVEAASPSDAAWWVMNQIVVLGIASPLDIIPQITISDGVSAAWPGGTTKYPIEAKELYDWVMETLKIGNHGLRAVLPPSDGSINTIEIGIYDGADRTQSVVFMTLQDQFDKTTHLLSNLGSKNVMTTEAKNKTVSVNSGTAYSGLARRVAYQNLTSEITTSSEPDLTNLATSKGKIALADLHPVALFSGEIAARQAARYNNDYFLGDKVSLTGEYGLTQSVRVSEFIRTQDRDGERSYPTFEAITP